MLKRKIIQQLREWRKNKREECLLVKGARQVGKTYAISDFGQTEYQKFITINFIESPELKAIFEGDLSSNAIKKRLSLFMPELLLSMETRCSFWMKYRNAPTLELL